MNLKPVLKAVAVSAVVLFGLTLGSGEALGMNPADVAKVKQAKSSNDAMMEELMAIKNACSRYIDIVNSFDDILNLYFFRGTCIDGIISGSSEAVSDKDRADREWGTPKYLNALSHLLGGIFAVDDTEALRGRFKQADNDWAALPKPNGGNGSVLGGLGGSVSVLGGIGGCNGERNPAHLDPTSNDADMVRGIRAMDLFAEFEKKSNINDKKEYFRKLQYIDKNILMNLLVQLEEYKSLVIELYEL